MKRDKEHTEDMGVETPFVEKPKRSMLSVHINIPNLAVRRGPGTNFSKTWKVIGDMDVELLKIVEGQGAKKGWGQLKNLEGWINLDFTDYEE